MFVRLDSVCRAYYFYVYGLPAVYFADSNSPAYFDVTRYCVDGRNTLCVVAYANPVSTELENQNSEQGTRIAGSDTVMAQPKVRIRDWVVDSYRLVAGSLPKTVRGPLLEALDACAEENEPEKPMNPNR